MLAYVTMVSKTEFTNTYASQPKFLFKQCCPITNSSGKYNVHD